MELYFGLAVLMITSLKFTEGQEYEVRQHSTVAPNYPNLSNGATGEVPHIDEYSKHPVLEVIEPEFFLEKYMDCRNFRHGCEIGEPCVDIRLCNMAAVSLAMGGVPVPCNWLGKGVPTVCCGYTRGANRDILSPKVLGCELHRKIEAEKARRRECGTRSFASRLSPTENNFYAILNAMPSIIGRDWDKFDPPLYGEGGAVAPAGGTPARQGEFPWMVLIKKDGEVWCGGSLIDRVHILTAAHCFTDTRDPANYMVYIGNVLVNRGYPSKIRKIAIHPAYSEDYHYHDLAILTLSEEILVPQIPHICLPDPQMSDLAGENTTLLGWGDTEFDGTGTDVLHFVDDLPVVPWQECRKKYQRIGEDTLPNGITEDFICAGLPEGGKDACQRDSGGPLMYEDKSRTRPSGENPWILVGVVSFGFLCAQPGYPGVYIRVANYMPWIVENMNQ